MIFFYSSNLPPKIIFINQRLSKGNLISKAINKKSGNRVCLKKPNRGKKLSLIQMAEQNIKISIDNKLKIKNSPESFTQIKRIT